eukprot:s1078_g5.t3
MVEVVSRKCGHGWTRALSPRKPPGKQRRAKTFSGLGQCPVSDAHLGLCHRNGFVDVLSLMNPFQTRTLAFISGFVNQTSRKSSSCRDVWMRSRNTVVQILIFGLLLEPICYPYMLGQKNLTFRGYLSEIAHQLLLPGRNVQWYLYGLLWWRSIDFVTARLHIAGRMALALMLSQVAKLQPSSFLTISESFACLPLFVAGAICRRKWMQIDEYIREELDNSMPLSPIFGNRIFQVVWGLTLFMYFHLARCVFGGIYTCPTGTKCPWKLPEIYHQDITWSTQVFSQLNGLAGDFMMLGQVVIFLLLICPRQQGFLTTTGRHTLFPYMLHHPLMPSAKQGMDWILSFTTPGLQPDPAAFQRPSLDRMRSKVLYRQ